MCTDRHTVYLTSPLQFPSKPPGVREPQFVHPDLYQQHCLNNEFDSQDYCILIKLKLYKHFC